MKDGIEPSENRLYAEKFPTKMPISVTSLSFLEKKKLVKSYHSH